MTNRPTGSGFVTETTGPKLFDPIKQSQRKASGLSAALRAVASIDPEVLMANPPTITWQPGSTSTIASAVFVPMTDARFVYDGAVGPAGTSSPLNAYYKSTNPPPEGSDNGGGPYSIHFAHIGAKFEAIFRGRASTGLRVRIDGQLVAADVATIGATPDTDGTDDLLIIPLASVKRRRITLECNNYLYFKGLNIGPTDSLGAVTGQTKPTWLVLGDSITRAPLTVVDHMRTYHQQLARAFGWNVIGSGLGGTGYCASNTGTNSPLPDRLSRDCLSIIGSLDGIIIAMGVNDRLTSAGFGAFGGNNYGYANLGANAASVYAQIRAAAPSIPLIVLSPFHYPNDIAGCRAVRDTIKPLALAAGASFIDMQDPTGESQPWIFGTGHGAFQPGDGNSDILESSSVPHPNQLGHDWTAARLVREITKLGVTA